MKAISLPLGRDFHFGYAAADGDKFVAVSFILGDDGDGYFLGFTTLFHGVQFAVVTEA